MKNQGQINRGTVLGEKIYELSKQQDVSYILDIGTWKGLGSTKCIVDGIENNNYFKRGLSIDCNLKRIHQALINLRTLPNNFEVKHGTIINTSELRPLLRKVRNNKFIMWFKNDLKRIKGAPNIFNELPSKIDLCIIDGGMFSGILEFNKLWGKCKYIVLDDTNTMKHSQTKKFILENLDKFEIILDVTDDRNGYLVCKNKEYV